jgi:hypothetical protein
MSDLRLAKLDAQGVIVRCYWGEVEDLKLADVREAPEPWAVEGVNYDQAKAAYEAQLAADAAAKQAEDDRLATIEQEPICVDLLDRLKAATPTQINNYIDANVTDLASARALFKRILLVMSLMLKG